MTLLLVLFIANKLHQDIPGVTSIDIVIKGCELDFYHNERLQPVFTIALACPRTDYIRLWPLPIKQPWSEEQEQPKRLRNQKDAFLVLLLPTVL